MHLNYFYAIWLLLCAKFVWSSKYNVSYTDLDKCKEFNAVGGYGYHTYFKVQDIRGDLESEFLFNIRLYVLSAKDAHILLSPTPEPDAQSRVYEIVLGAGGNTFSEIRKKRKTQGIKTVRRMNLLSPIDPLPIDIRLSKSGLIEVQVVGEPTSFLNATDPVPVPVSYISFSTWGASEGKWFYDCEIPKYEEIKRFSNMSAYERLHYDLLNDYDVSVHPENLTYLPIQFEIKRVIFNTLKSTLETRGILRMNWTDPKLIWNPANYSNIDGLRSGFTFGQTNVWYPSINLVNGKDKFFKGFNPDLNIHIQTNGQVIAETNEINFKTWCSDIGAYRNWPADELICNIEFGVNNGIYNLKPADNFLKIQNMVYDSSEWHLIQANVTTKSPKLYFYSDEENFGYSTINLVYQLQMKRNNQFYSRVFCPPLIVSFIFVLLSFWSTKFIRIALNLLGVLIISGMFVAIADYAPNSYVPTLVMYYQAALVLSWLTVLIFVVNSYLEKYPPESEPWQWLKQTLQMQCFRFTSSSYHIANEVSWQTIIDIVDKIFFIIFSVLFVIALIIGI